MLSCILCVPLLHDSPIYLTFTMTNQLLPKAMNEEVSEVPFPDVFPSRCYNKFNWIDSSVKLRLEGGERNRGNLAPSHWKRCGHQGNGHRLLMEDELLACLILRIVLLKRHRYLYPSGPLNS